MPAVHARVQGIEERHFHADTDHQLRRAYSMRNTGARPFARKLVEKVLKTDPTNSNAYCILGILSDIKMEKYRAFKHALEIDPKNKQAKKEIKKLQESGYKTDD